MFIFEKESVIIQVHFSSDFTLCTVSVFFLKTGGYHHQLLEKE